MSDPIGATLHGKALLAFGFDLASLRQGMELPGVRWFLSGFTRAREALGTLVLIASLSMERYSAAATVGRRYLWINALGCDSKEWKYSPGNHRRLGNGWLQEAYSHSSHPYPRHRSGLR